jgi:hypothetical protein
MRTLLSVAILLHLGTRCFPAQEYLNGDSLMARDFSEKPSCRTGTVKNLSNNTYTYNDQEKYDTALNLNLRTDELVALRIIKI